MRALLNGYFLFLTIGLLVATSLVFSSIVFSDPSGQARQLCANEPTHTVTNVRLGPPFGPNYAATRLYIGGGMDEATAEFIVDIPASSPAGGGVGVCTPITAEMASRDGQLDFRATGVVESGTESDWSNVASTVCDGSICLRPDTPNVPTTSVAP